MIHDQADNLRELVRQRPLDAAPNRATPLVTVVGGKGGVGASTIAANLALALAAQGRRAALVEADLQHSAAGLVADSTSGSIVDALSGRRSASDLLERGPGGIRVIQGVTAADGAVEASAAAQQRFIAELKNLAPDVDVVIVDAGSGRNAFLSRLWHSADLGLLVTTADSSSIMESYATIKSLAGKTLASSEPSARIHLVVNRVASGTATEGAIAAEVHYRIAGACRRFLALRVQLAGWIPRDASGAGLRTSGGSRIRLFRESSPGSVAAHAAERLAERVWSAVVKREHQPQNGLLAATTEVQNRFGIIGSTVAALPVDK